MPLWDTAGSEGTGGGPGPSTEWRELDLREVAVVKGKALFPLLAAIAALAVACAGEGAGKTSPPSPVESSGAITAPSACGVRACQAGDGRALARASGQAAAPPRAKAPPCRWGRPLWIARWSRAPAWT